MFKILSLYSEGFRLGWLICILIVQCIYYLEDDTELMVSTWTMDSSWLCDLIASFLGNLDTKQYHIILMMTHHSIPYHLPHTIPYKPYTKLHHRKHTIPCHIVPWIPCCTIHNIPYMYCTTVIPYCAVLPYTITYHIIPYHTIL